MSEDTSIDKIKERMVAETMKKLAENFNPVSEIRKLYPHRVIPGTYFNRRFKSDRRAIGEFMGIEAIRNLGTTINNFMKRVENPRIKSWGDIFIIYLVDETPDDLEDARDIMKTNPVNHQRVMVALPKQPSNLGGHLLLYKTINTLYQIDKDTERKQAWYEKLNELKFDLKELIQWENWDWFYMGGVVEKQDDISENGVVSIFLEKIYPRTIYPGLRALGYHHGHTARDRKSVKLAINRILDIYSPLIITREKSDLASVILRQIAQIGLLTRVSKAGWEEEWIVRTEPSPDSPVAPLWDKLYKDVLGRSQSGEEVSFREVFDIFKKPPYGTTTAFMKIIFSLFWRNYHHQVKLYNYGRGVRKEKDTLNFQRLCSLVRHPDNWKIGIRYESKVEREYLKAIIKIFDPNMAEEDPPDSLLEIAKKLVLTWFNNLPKVIYLDSYEDEEISSFLRTINQHKNKNGRELFLRYIPECLGFQSLSLQLEKNAGKITEKLSRIASVLNQKAKEFRDALWSRMVALFELPADKNLMQAHLDKWLAEIEAEKFSVSYRGDCKVLYEVITGDKNKSVELRLMHDLPIKMGMGDMKEWETNRISEIVARLDKARFQMSAMQYMDFKDIKDPEKKREFINAWFLKLFQKLEFSREEIESFLENYLEEVAG